MSTPRISIIIPLYNQAQYIGRCLESIFNQTLADFEVIVVNDGSTDAVAQALKPWEEKITIINQENGGAPQARNNGFAKSSGDYLLFCDADAILQPEALEKMFRILCTTPSAAYAYSSFKFGWKKFKLWPFDDKKLRQLPYIHTTSLIRRDCFPGFDESLKKFQDWDLWLTLLENGHRGVWINEVLFCIVARGTMSKWLPKFLFKLPGVKISEVKKYRNAKKLIYKKHKIKFDPAAE